MRFAQRIFYRKLPIISTATQWRLTHVCLPPSHFKEWSESSINHPLQVLVKDTGRVIVRGHKGLVPRSSLGRFTCLEASQCLRKLSRSKEVKPAESCCTKTLTRDSHETTACESAKGRRAKSCPAEALTV